MVKRKISVPYSPSIGSWLQELRENKGLTQRELADILGLSTPQMISNWENGRCAPSFSQLAVLSKVFDVTQKEMIDKLMDEQRKIFSESFSELT
ncbi:MAG: helix-turn-helix transcriptional regulator [Pseudobacteriovorax sp.]|nr:helix-turn-helix transcriptional regulator [Pseudobacteriovorax sp.]